jgi:hypothetical protein
MPQPLRRAKLSLALTLSIALAACDGGSSRTTAMAHRVPLLALSPDQQRGVPLAVAIKRMSDGGDGLTVSVL